jgi:hypothetical protein
MIAAGISGKGNNNSSHAPVENLLPIMALLKRCAIGNLSGELIKRVHVENNV